MLACIYVRLHTHTYIILKIEQKYLGDLRMNKYSIISNLNFSRLHYFHSESKNWAFLKMFNLNFLKIFYYTLCKQAKFPSRDSYKYFRSTEIHLFLIFLL